MTVQPQTTEYLEAVATHIGATFVPEWSTQKEGTFRLAEGDEHKMNCTVLYCTV